jgi:hypothetical protein
MNDRSCPRRSDVWQVCDGSFHPVRRRVLSPQPADQDRHAHCPSRRQAHHPGKHPPAPLTRAVSASLSYPVRDRADDPDAAGP